MNDGAAQRTFTLEAGVQPRNARGINITTIRTVTLATLAIVTTLGSALADERISVTPTLYREQARTTAAVRPAAELTTTPRLVPTAPVGPRQVVEAVIR